MYNDKTYSPVFKTTATSKTPYTYETTETELNSKGSCICDNEQCGYCQNGMHGVFEGDAVWVGKPKKTGKFESDLTNVLSSLKKFLMAKNSKYGNSALEPLRIFSKSETEDGILKRMDDKLSRIKNSDVLRKNDIVDLTGYLVILCINNGWTDFDEMVD